MKFPSSDTPHPDATDEEREAVSMADPAWIVILTCRDSRINHGPGCQPCDEYLAGPMVYFLEITA